MPPTDSQVVDRSRPVTFTFNGRTFSAYAGDTIASALVAADVRAFSRSFKYHRPRGLLCVSGDCPNCLVQVEDEPNVRACRCPVEDGMQVHAQNVWPSLGLDFMSLLGFFERFLPAGFYYKTFMRPKALWPLYERALRKAAGLGKVDPETERSQVDELHLHADVAVVGAGAAGLNAALSAAELGARVILLEEDPWMGGQLLYRGGSLDGRPLSSHAENLTRAVSENESIRVFLETNAFGCYDQRWIGASQGERLLKLRPRSVVFATGATEAPALFVGNDLPGVMLAGGVQRLLRLWGVLPGRQAVVASGNRHGLQVALDLHRAGVDVACVAERRLEPDEDLMEALQQDGIEVQRAAWVERAEGRRRVRAVRVSTSERSESRKVSCDLLVLAVGLTPADNLLHQAGATFHWDEQQGQFLPERLPPSIYAAGGAAGTHHIRHAAREGEWAGLQAAIDLGLGTHADRLRCDQLASGVKQARRARTPWTAQIIPKDEQDGGFVCFCEDVKPVEVRQSIREGFDSLELLKRYSTISMGPCQGKMCGRTAMRLCSRENGQPMAEIGSTTSRPPVRPVTFGTLAGREAQPVRETPLHGWHEANGARMMVAGLWMRPEHYGDPELEVRAVREKVGLIDVSTLGKIHLHGPDVPDLLERVYTNRWRGLDVGRVRYGMMVNEEGVILDDGVTARLERDFYYMTTTSSGAQRVHAWIEWWLQSGWDLDLHVVDAVDLRAAMNLTGPNARRVLSAVCEDVDLDPAAFPYMHARRGLVAGAPAILMRIGFTGELGYEIHVPSGFGLHVWRALMDAGRAYGVQPFGVEAQRVLRLEKGHLIVGQDSDSLTDPYEAGAGWAVKLDKQDFLGKPSLQVLQDRGRERRLVGFEMLNGALPEEADQIVRPGDGPIGYEMIGRITSVRRSPTLDKVIGLAWMPVDAADPGTTFTVRSHGALLPGRVVETPFYDPHGKKLRA
jgi:sarcosine oxidase subunit alpha